MMVLRRSASAVLALALGGCVTVHPPETIAGCRADAVQDYLGRTATASLGGELLRAANARELRWVAPGMMVTMDYRAQRLTVSYDEAMRITTISCG